MRSDSFNSVHYTGGGNNDRTSSDMTDISSWMPDVIYLREVKISDRKTQPLV